jgi:Ca2+-binding RTX toxin-like protein
MCDPNSGRDFNRGREWRAGPRGDPLALDLNGNGMIDYHAAVDAVQFATGSTVLFDADGDGVRTGMGWVGEGDAWLARDLDGNGMIDSGRELFGDQTLLANGERASDGFAALAALDSNADGVFDAQDAAYGEVLVWRDLNQDGVSQADELQALEAAGVASVALAAEEQPSFMSDSRGIMTHAGSFTRMDGSVGLAANIIPDAQPFFSQFTDSIPLTAEALLLPGMQGSGMVRNLQEAASLSPELAGLLAQAQHTVTRGELAGMLPGIVGAWADTSTLATSQQQAAALGMRLYFVRDMTFAGFVPQFADGLDLSGDALTAFRAGLDEYLRTAFDEVRANMQQAAWMVGVLERFNGQTLVNVEAGRVVTPGTAGAIAVPFEADDQGRIFFPLRNGLLDSSLSLLTDSVYAALAVQTRLAAYFSEIGFSFDADGNMAMDFTDLNARLDALRQSDAANALTDLVELYRYSGADLLALGWDRTADMRAWIEEAAPDPGMAGLMQDLQLSADPDAFLRGDRSATLLGQAGDDWFGGDGGRDVLLGGAGNDYIVGGQGDDLLAGEAGNDFLQGGTGNDLYLFGRGGGQDSVSTYEPTGGGHDVIQFAPDVRPEDVIIKRQDNSLVLEIADTGDAITVDNHFVVDIGGRQPHAIGEVRFADGTSWSGDGFRWVNVEGTEEADTLGGYGGGYDTHDYLVGKGGDDSLLGGVGDDVLDGGAGNDDLQGGTGNDAYVMGHGYGLDTVHVYVWGGEGHDVVLFAADIAPSQVFINRVGDDLVLQLSEQDALTVSRHFAGPEHAIREVRFTDGTVWSGAALLPAITGTDGDDAIGLGDGDFSVLAGEGNNSIGLGDGASSVTAGAGDDAIGLGVGQYTVDAGDGYNNISVQGGHADITGGAGVDDIYLASGSAVIHAGDGLNMINAQYASGPVEVHAGVDADNIWIGDGSHWVDAGEGNNSISLGDGASNVTAGAGDDAISLGVGQYAVDAGDGYNNISVQGGHADITGGAGVDDIYLASGTAVIHAGGGANLINAQFTDGAVHVITGAEADSIQLGAGADNVEAGGGNDQVSADAGDDLLAGGAGNDWLEGGLGDDRYLYARGDGQDSIWEQDGQDSLAFTSGVTHDQLWFSQDGGDLLISLVGTDDQVRINGWMSGGPDFQVERIETADDGRVLLEGQVQALVDAMAAFSPPAPGETSLPADVRQALEPVLAAAWLPQQ